ncbi:penicillin-binding protein activator [Pseudofulvimonas gallinarii]|uniref:Penicillin-binding protein activator n=2 Tax=Pseudofulvimonas gallinarii TaxID=634155 RepID=A0A4R3L8K8_9GAMM|nr:penicillin-binding protein activator [Pseudofulvimonas gallinarii]TCS95999.1 hypothetical protein EDC25_1179 [Pseudofulvimonas gallinarii]
MNFQPVHAARCGLLIVAVFIAACATAPGSTPGGSTVKRAEQAWAAGDYATAAAEYLAAASRGSAPDRAYLRLRAAESHRQAGNVQGVREVAGSIAHRDLQGDEPLRLDLLLAEVALSDGDAERALTLLTVPTDQVPDRLRPRVLRARADALAARGDSLASARERAALLPLVDEAERADAMQRISAVLADVPPRELYRESARLGPEDPLKALADQALRAHGITPPRLVTGGRDPMAPREPPPTDADGRALYGKVALLVPLSGQMGVPGQAVRDGFMAAYFAGAEPRPQVEVIDAGSTPESALAAYERALENGAERVVGPLSREAVSAVFNHPILPVPVLALNHADGVSPPQGSAQFGLLPDEEALAAADRFLQLGVLRVAMVSMNEDWSERSALAFRTRLELGGGEVVADVRVQRNDYDLRRRAESISNSQPEGVFLALSAQSARLLVPQMKALGVTGTWLAMSRVYGGTPLPAVDRDLDGVEFCDAPWVIGSAVGVPSRNELAQSVNNIQGPALRLFAFGMDAYRLLGYVDWLSQRPYSFIHGATGELSVDQAAQVRRQLAWARFQDGVPVPTDGALNYTDY